MRRLLWLFLLGAAFGQIPDNPQPQPKPPGFFAFRKSWQEPPLRTNKQVFTSKAILISHGMGFAAMIVACSRKNSRESWSSEVPAMLGSAGLDYIGDRYFTRSFAVGPMLYAVFHYTKAAAQ